jgi:homoserine O-succinyltransferase
VDAFVKQRGSLFVFFQGHPEYEAVTLLLEYRRDIGRFLRSERETYPDMPEGYFDLETVRTLTALRERALVDRREELLSEFPIASAATKVNNTWRSAGENLYGNWLKYLHTQKAQHAAAGIA